MFNKGYNGLRLARHSSKVLSHFSLQNEQRRENLMKGS